jgi:RNA polymerase sigma-70 factor (ECF subfamily)
MGLDLGALFRDYHESLVRMLTRRTGDRGRAEELAQETFARAVAAPPTNPRPWLFAVALNLLREEGRNAATRERRLLLVKDEEHVAAYEQPDEAYEREETRLRVRAALAQLSERDRDVLLLQAEGFDYDEIAQATGLSRGAIGTTLARARKRLTEVYTQGEGGEHVARG